MSTTNELTKTYSGILGNQVVLKSRKGKSTITIPPTKPEKAPSLKQIQLSVMFQCAAQYARNAMQDPVLLAAYTEKSGKGLTPYRVAVNDYLKRPRVHSIVASGYEGNPGDKISITATDNFRVVEVAVQIVDPAGAVIEKGVCAFSLPTGTYEYTATVPVTVLTGVTIIAKATDLPGHTGELAITL